MGYKSREIISHFEKIIDPKLQEDWDNSGWQITTDELVNSIMVCMDLNMDRVDYAIKNNIKLIVTHHPLFFSGVKNISDDYKSVLIKKLVENHIGVYSSHTCLDKAKGGVNDILFDFLNLVDKEALSITEDGNWLGLVGTNKNFQTIQEIVNHLEKNLLDDGYIVYGKENCKVNKIAILGGSGASEIDSAIKKSDVYITSDIKHHDGQYAYENNLVIINISHNDSEKLVLNHIANIIKSEFNVEICVFLENAFSLKLNN